MSKYCLNCKHCNELYCDKHTIEVSEDDYCVDWEVGNYDIFTY